MYIARVDPSMNLPIGISWEESVVLFWVLIRTRQNSALEIAKQVEASSIFLVRINQT
jgi:hypothetical protein